MTSIQFNKTNLTGRVSVPNSKSILQRIMLLQALYKQTIYTPQPQDANDVHILYNALFKTQSSSNTIVIDVQDSGTGLRFLTAYLSIQEGQNFLLQGTKRLHERPIRELVEALRTIGACIEYADKDGFAPLRISGKKLIGGSIEIAANISSQYLSALCMIAPLLENGLRIQLMGTMVSASYIMMSLNVLKKQGIASTFENNIIQIGKQDTHADIQPIEGDWSSACFFYAMAMLVPQCSLFIENLNIDSYQGDKQIVVLAENFGIQTSTEKNGIRLTKKVAPSSIQSACISLKEYPDLAIPFIVACAIAYPQISFSGLHHLQYKESNRIEALQRQLKKIGIVLQYKDDVLHIVQHNIDKEVCPTLCSHNDHRIAMAMSMLAIILKRVEIENPHCVNKSFPSFWEELKLLGFEFGYADV
ncbi:MAG: 3-phosphoshikimate 1-carboxyvinyltransferase [Chitinophagaceae bacterium]